MVDQSRFCLGGSAPENYDRFLGVVMEPISTETARRAGVGPGLTVLDVACGTGVSSRAAAQAVGAGGRVVGVDPNAAMLAVARAASRMVTPGIEWHEGLATALPFGDGEFDAIICNQGLQYFPDLEAAAREMARVTRAGASMAASFWMARESSPYQVAVTNAANALGGALGEAFAGLHGNDLQPDVAVGAFREARWRDVEVDAIHVSVVFPPLRGFVAGHVMGLPVSAHFAALGDADRARFVEAVVAELAAYRNADGTSTVPFGTNVLTAKR